jgi:hypothetical protein
LVEESEETTSKTSGVERRIILKWILEYGTGHGLDSSGTGWRPI